MIKTLLLVVLRRFLSCLSLSDEKDRDLLRFLWWEDDSLTGQPVHLRMCVHLFGATSSPGVATFGLRKIASLYGATDTVNPLASHFIQHNFYVDDGLLSVASAEDAVEVFRDTKDILAKGGLKCHKLRSSSKLVLDGFPDEDKVSNASEETKTLGVYWNTSSDTLITRFEIDVENLTKRSLLSLLAQIYDPLGFVSPISLYGKNILQDMNRLSLAWDECPPPDLQKRFHHLKNMAASNTPVRVSRSLFAEVGSVLKEVHIFCDASQIGYAAVAYAKFQKPDGQYSTSFLLGKSRVAPLKPALTIPRLELVAATLATSLSLVIRKEMNLDDCNIFYWTDSLVVLGYLRNEKTRYKVFVSNRVSFIVSNTSPPAWNHIKGTENPADFGSRGIWSENWIEGPPFLREEWSQDTFVSIEKEHELAQPESNDAEVICLNTVSAVKAEDKIISSRSWLQTLRLWGRLRRWSLMKSRPII